MAGHARCAMFALLTLLSAGVAASPLNSTVASGTARSAAMEDLLDVGAGSVTCPGGAYSCPTGSLCVCDRSRHCVACLTHAASLNHGEVAAVGAIAQILEDKFVRAPRGCVWFSCTARRLSSCVATARTSTASPGQRGPCRTSSTRITTTSTRRTVTWRRILCMV